MDRRVTRLGLLLCAATATGCRADALDRHRETFRAPDVSASPAPSPSADPVARLVDALASPDFVTRCRASADLLALGDAAVPALGRAGDRPVPVHEATTASTTRPVLTEILAASTTPRLVDEHLSSPYPSVRRAALLEARRRPLEDLVPSLLARLESPDPAVRVAAQEALEELTEHRPGTSPVGTVQDADHLARWRAWWAAHGAAAQPAPPGPR